MYDVRKKKPRQARSPLFYIVAACGGCVSLIAIACCVVILTGAGLAFITQRSRVTEVEQRTFALDDPDATVNLSITMDNGTIHIIGDDTIEEVQVEAERIGRGFDRAHARSALESIEIDYNDQLSEEGHLTINVVSEALDFGDIIPVLREVNFVVHLPPNVTVDLETSNGSITIDNIQAVETSRVKTSNGSIEVNDSAFASNLTLETSNGAVTVIVAQVDGLLRTETSNGSIQLTDVVATGGMVVSTRNGSVELTGTLDIEAGTQYHLTTSNGTINVRLLGELPAFRLIATTNNGNIDNKLPLTAASREGEKAVNGYYNGGSTDNLDDTTELPTLRLETDNGEITIRGPS